MAAALVPTMRDDGAGQLYGACKVGRDLAIHLSVSEFLKGTNRTVTRIADHRVDTPEGRECRIHLVLNLAVSVTSV